MNLETPKQTHFAAFPLFQVVKRSQRRAMEQEYKRLSLKTAEIEVLFAKDVHDPIMPYQMAYKIRLAQYIKKCEFIQQAFSPKYIVMNPNYFKEMYGIENKMVKPRSLFNDINELIRQRLWFM